MEDTGAWVIAAPLPRQGGYAEPDHHARTGEPDGDDAAAGTEPHRATHATHETHETHASHDTDTDEGQHDAAAPTADAGAGTGPAAPAEESTLEVERPRVTDTGLPKRTPRIVDHGTGEVRKPAARVDAEELRRRLGGFYQGARDGRRVADAELAEQRQRAQDEGDTVEEART
jgi:hypothetical protein